MNSLETNGGSTARCEIFIVTHAKDFPWLYYCLRSIAKFATGFTCIKILVPEADVLICAAMPLDWKEVTTPVKVVAGDEWPGRGMLWHMAQIMRADEWCPDADYIVHLDPDCIFTAPVTPETFIKDGKPLLRYENFAVIGRRHPGVLRWQEAANKCLPFPALYETMRCHPEVYHHGLYAAAREQMEARTGMPVDGYIQTCTNQFPQTFCEFVTLGNVAMRLFPEKYVCVEQKSDTVTPTNNLQQFWSHGDMDKPQNIWVNGVQREIVPLEMIKQFGLA